MQTFPEGEIPGQSDVERHALNQSFEWAPPEVRPRLLSDAQVEAWNNDGCFVLENALDPSTVARTIAEIDPHEARVEPLFTGSRSNPLANAAIRELTPGTFTPGHMARALFEAMAAQ